MNTSFKRYSIAAELLTSVVYQQYMPTEIQPRYKTSIFALCGSHKQGPLTTPFLFRLSHSLWLMEVGLFIKIALFGQQPTKIAQNIFINNLKTAFCPCHSFFSLPSALNYRFPLFKICTVLNLLFLRECCGSACQEIQKGFHMHLLWFALEAIWNFEF